MFHTLATILLLPFFVYCQTSANGNLSAPAVAVAVSSTTTTLGIGGYILAALGATSSVTPSTSSNVPSTGTGIFSNASLPVWGSLVSSSPASATPKPSTVCLHGTTGLCYTDITYSAVSVAPTGTGSAYASECAKALRSYSSVSSSWGAVHSSVVESTATLGGISIATLSYYRDASTLCDGHPRVTYSPAILLSTKVSTIAGLPSSTTTFPVSMGWAFPVSAPSCSIQTNDCDNLWQAYSTSLSRWDAQQYGASASPHGPPNAARVTASPLAPPCVDSERVAAQSSVMASLTECGPCTIFGNGVQLLYFPPPSTVSRDMCASTPSASVTYFKDDAATVYNGSGPVQTNFTGELATIDGKTFTSGTAYISIATVWTGDRCSASMGTPVTDALLAMPSESVLSLRYSQDHFQYFFDIKTVTGYPLDFADMREPVPYSAWAGQEMCDGANAWNCQVIYENDFNPQLAMPPGIRSLRPEWENCKMWYGGLYDPPRALAPATAVATATLPSHMNSKTAEPSSSIASSTPIATVLADSVSSAKTSQAYSLTAPEETAANTQSAGNTQASNSLAASPTSPTTIEGVPVSTNSVGAITFGGQTLSVGGGETIIGGTTLSAATAGLVVNGVTSSYADTEQPSQMSAQQTSSAVSNLDKAYSATGAMIEIGSTVYTVSEEPVGGIAVDGTTISENGPAVTISGVVVTAVADDVVVAGSTIYGFSGIGDVISTSIAGSADGPGTIDGATPSQEAMITIGGSPVTAYSMAGASGVVVVGSATLSLGGPAETLSNGDVVSLASGGIAVEDSSSTSTIDFSYPSHSSSSATSRAVTSQTSNSRVTTSRTSATSAADTMSASATSKSGSSLNFALQGYSMYLGLALCMYFLI
ncbi:hypothetical protein BDV97DRAFT_401412 [Delphinella strobiligena]|nr:hypothetical protein BDV97DRAFT_401412 [Delphinella strobiligena]